jgi:hypothetical protein
LPPTDPAIYPHQTHVTHRYRQRAPNTRIRAARVFTGIKPMITRIGGSVRVA